MTADPGIRVSSTDSVAHGYFGRWRVLLDGETVGHLARGKSLTRVVSAGEHFVRVQRDWHTSHDIVVTAVAGQLQTVEFSPSGCVGEFNDSSQQDYFEVRLLPPAATSGLLKNTRGGLWTHRIITALLIIVGVLDLVGGAYVQGVAFLLAALGSSVFFPQIVTRLRARKP